MRTAISIILCVLFLCPVCFAEGKSGKPSSMKVPLPPLIEGGLTSLWYHDHKFILSEYGAFDLLNFSNAGFKVSKDSLNAYSWTLLAMGDFMEKEISYATLARVKNNDKGILLIMFRWIDPADSSKTHGVFYRTFIKKDKLLLRTKQCTTGAVDTLEITCGNLKKRCAICYYDGKKAEMVLKMEEEKEKKKEEKKKKKK